MSEIITATFVDGVFKPDAKVDLAAGAKVQLVVTPVGEAKRAEVSSLPRLTREQLHDRPTLHSRREQARERIQREWDATVQKRQEAFDEMERLRTEHSIDTRGERLTREQLHERR